MLRRLFRSRPPTATSRLTRIWPPATGIHHAAAARPPLTVGQIRGHQFSTARRGLDPNEVRGFLYQVADEVADLRAELIRTRTENNRIKKALRDWQSRYKNRGVWL
ncbi:DivIVA domain-containing protein [Plantactinospora soyae]|uniref:Cell wall synthesis protein Wag31 n=1 Tax=Plantactinospora soyae TaxID=1544732 RepID=A0A927M4K5_9ACTN|nr:DivIVA domain-containing protein [Plantactinospora soyae]MBE1486695.1 DivIVA domain-containing protein [Plantactinospora soyae]